jgi:phenylacetate-CoA ligase
LLITVLFSRTLPLIRYELTDRVRLATSGCACGLPFRLLSAVEGRTDEVLELPNAQGGKARIHPIVFHRVFEGLRVSGWQVRKEAWGLRILIAGMFSETDATALGRRVALAVEAAGGALPQVAVEVVLTIPAGAGSKRPLVLGPSRPRETSDGLTA